jgi:5-methyltetrahydrofolate--homocysteine methyltransferase
MDLLAELRTRTLLFDGAMGTQLIAAGYRPVESPESWNVSDPDIVVGIHRAYLEAGADIIETNTFGGSRSKLTAYHAGERVAELNTAGARLATGVRDEVASGRLVAGDIGPSGRMMPPLGDATPDELRDVFAEQAEALVAGGVDLISMTTFFDIEEAKAAVLGVRAMAGSLPVLISLAFKPSPRGYHTMMGVTPAQAAATLLDAGADVVGANCEITAEEMLGLVAELRAATTAPLVIQPNAGQPRLADGHTVYGETPERFASFMPAIVAAGANIVGGCCGTTPAHIAALAAALGR